MYVRPYIYIEKISTFIASVGLAQARPIYLMSKIWLLSNIQQTYMWQSRVEIEHYFVAYFDRSTAFEAL